MNTLSIPQFTIADTIINVVDGLYSLNDLHKASGGEKKHQPNNFMRNEETKALIDEINSEDTAPQIRGAGKSSDAQIRASVKNKAFRVIKGNFGAVKQGTYVCKELVYRYAMWISPKFALLVIRTFDALVSRTDSKQRECLITACDRLAVGNTLRSDVYTQVANHFGYERVTQIPTPLLPEAVAFVYNEILARQKNNQPPVILDAIFGEKYRLVGEHANNENYQHMQALQNELNHIQHIMQKMFKLNNIVAEGLASSRAGIINNPEQKLKARQQAKEMIDSHIEKKQMFIPFTV